MWTNQEICYLSPRTHIIHTGSCRYSNKNHLLATNQAAKHVIFRETEYVKYVVVRMNGTDCNGV